jgi:hypothetical protein
LVFSEQEEGKKRREEKRREEKRREEKRREEKRREEKRREEKRRKEKRREEKRRGKRGGSTNCFVGMQMKDCLHKWKTGKGIYGIFKIMIFSAIPVDLDRYTRTGLELNLQDSFYDHMPSMFLDGELWYYILQKLNSF